MVWRGRLSVRLSGRLSVCLSAKLVNTLQTEPFKLGRSNLVHILLMIRGRTLLIFKVMGQRAVSARTVKLGTDTTYDKRTNPFDFQGHGSKVKVTR